MFLLTILLASLLAQSKIVAARPSPMSPRDLLLTARQTRDDPVCDAVYPSGDTRDIDFSFLKLITVWDRHN